MTNRTEQPSRGRASRVLPFAVFALLAMCLPGAASAQWATSGTTTSTTNNVGIGTSTPAQMFHVHGPSSWAGTRVTTAGTGPTWGDGVNFGYDDTLGAMVWNREASPIIFATSNVEKMRLNPAGQLGIGTSTPGKKFEVLAADGDAARFYRDAADAGYGVNITFALNNSNNARTDYAGVHGMVGNPAAGAEAGNLVFTTATGGALTEKMRLDAAGNLGIGTTTPATALHLAGATAPKLAMSDTGMSHGVTDHARSDVFFQVEEAYLDNTGGARLWGFSAAAHVTPFRVVGIFGNPTPNDQIPAVWFLAGRRSGTAIVDVGSSTTAFQVAGAGTGTTYLNILGSGNVGVGTLAPAAKLHVAGDIRVDGNINAKYQDVAEWVPSTQKLQAGTVVVLDTRRSNHMLASHSAYDTRVAGVISAQPGISLGEAGEGKVLVATTGRVKVKVDATRAPIQIGDLIVTSDVEGVAMKSEPMQLGARQLHAPGTIIGKALEPLAGGTGEILVLLSLQ